MNSTTCVIGSLLSVMTMTAMANEPRYAIIDLGSLGGDALSTAPGSIATSVSSSGMAVGTSVTGDTDGTLGAFIWMKNAMQLLAPGLPANLVRASAISDSGIIIGVAYDLGDTEPSAIQWTNGTPVTLGLFEGVDVNDVGHVAGRRMIPPMQAQTMAVAHLGAGLIDLGTFGGSSSGAYGIDGLDRIVGSADNTVGIRRPFLWNGTLHDLGTLGGAGGEAMKIATTGWIVGWSRRSDGAPHATRWQIDAGGAVLQTIDLGELGGGFSYAYDVAADGRCVGTSDSRAFLWADGVMTDLNDLVSDELGWSLYTANAINGEYIVGHGRHLGLLRAYLMRPAAPADVNGNGFVNIDDLLDVIQAFGPCAGCPEDVNCNGTVNIDDLVAVLNAWTN
ncbi:MAG: hypothetical protein KC983_02860 [Phycisphaerales bacterium]|nr:hypothetical protein [Phycisphaerales bacterium]